MDERNVNKDTDTDHEIDRVLSIPIIIVASIFFISMGYGIVFKGSSIWLIIWISERLF